MSIEAKTPDLHTTLHGKIIVVPKEDPRFPLRTLSSISGNISTIEGPKEVLPIDVISTFGSPTNKNGCPEGQEWNKMKKKLIDSYSHTMPRG